MPSAMRNKELYLVGISTWLGCHRSAVHSFTVAQLLLTDKPWFFSIQLFFVIRHNFTNSDRPFMGDAKKNLTPCMI